LDDAQISIASSDHQAPGLPDPVSRETTPLSHHLSFGQRETTAFTEDATNEVKMFSSLDKAVPDFTAKKLYIKIDYYREDIDTDINVSAGISYDKSCLYTFNIETKRYERKIDIAPYEDTENTSAGVRHFKKVYSLLGVTANNWCFLTTPRPDGYILELIDMRSNKIYTRTLTVSADELAYNAFYLSPDGILSAVLAGNEQAEMVWWRTNEITGASTHE